MGKSKTFRIKPDILKHYRTESSYTQLALAEAINKSLDGIKRIERHGRTTLKTAETIADVLGVSLKALEGKTENLLTNYWAQYGSVDQELSEPGKLFRYSSEMFEWIKKEIFSLRFSYEGEFKRHAKFSHDGLFSTLHFSEYQDTEDLIFRFAKVRIDSEKGIMTTSMSDFERSLLDREIERFLQNNATSFECPNKLLREGNCYLVTVSNLINEETHTCPSTPISDVTIPSYDGSQSFVRTVFDSHVFQNSLDCVGAISRWINAREVLNFVSWDHDESVAIMLNTKINVPIVIRLERKHRDQNGVLHDATFPYKKEIADRIKSFEHPYQLGLNEVSLGEYPARHTSWNYCNHDKH
ncbi:helix-turn-helix domain-containing protein [Thalassospira sp.]|uniref:helix-turn-helix domain-containing protein n=1 Tax=Thalassospira sp. TaxID=1912094 RepID=UPI00260591F9|nr:helix-turn-helix domain-containing protein [Thalassospira sp.]MCH2275184.1 helix-turn-helix domain-containing protein [Thalassospira sp.]